jgi:hypothetical protein
MSSRPVPNIIKKELKDSVSGDFQQIRPKRSGWHKKRQNPSPVAGAKLEPEENPPKRMKPQSQLTVKFEPVPEPVAMKIDTDHDGDDALMANIGLNPVVHVPRCVSCGSQNRFQENDEAALVCTTCGAVQSTPELRRGSDSPAEILAHIEDKHTEREVSVKPFRV